MLKKDETSYWPDYLHFRHFHLLGLHLTFYHLILYAYDESSILNSFSSFSPLLSLATSIILSLSSLTFYPSLLALAITIRMIPKRILLSF